MKNITTKLFALIVIAVLGTSCGVSSALQLNQHASVTNVTLSEANFKVVGRAKGIATQEYILMIGGIDKAGLYANAKADLMNNANLTGTSKALVNITAEEHTSGVPPFYIKRSVTYSADVVEFNQQ